MRIQLKFVIEAVCLASCGSSNDAEATAIATAAEPMPRMVRMRPPQP